MVLQKPDSTEYAELLGPLGGALWADSYQSSLANGWNRRRLFGSIFCVSSLTVCAIASVPKMTDAEGLRSYVVRLRMRPAVVDSQTVQFSRLINESVSEVDDGLPLNACLAVCVVESDDVDKKRVMAIATGKLSPRQSSAAQRPNLHERESRFVERSFGNDRGADAVKDSVIGNARGSHAVLEHCKRVAFLAGDDGPQGGSGLIPRCPVRLCDHRKLQVTCQVLQRLDELGDVS